MNTNETITPASSDALVPAATPTPSSPAPSGLSRRSFLRRGAAVGAALPLIGMMANRGYAAGGDTPTAGDIALLKFLAAAELLETDLWTQYTELALNNPNYKSALKAIDPALPEYIEQDARDENAHQAFINAYLVSIGQTAVDLSPFATLKGSVATGVNPAMVGKRLTNLTNLTVDTAWFLRYREGGNPDFGDTFPQVANIIDTPTIPPINGISAKNMDTIARAAAFHFGSIEQGGSSLYGSLILKASVVDVVSILASIGPTEFYHLATFMTSLQGIFLNREGLAADSMPAPCKYAPLTDSGGATDAPNGAAFPEYNSILRPTSTAKAGAVATVTYLASSNLFMGQSNAFVSAATGLAVAADAAVRS